MSEIRATRGLLAMMAFLLLALPAHSILTFFDPKRGQRLQVSGVSKCRPPDWAKRVAALASRFFAWLNTRLNPACFRAGDQVASRSMEPEALKPSSSAGWSIATAWQASPSMEKWRAK